MSPILQNSPLEFGIMFSSTHKYQKKAQKNQQTPSVWIKVFLLPIALPQGQLSEVPIYIKIFTIKAVGQTILAQVA